MPSRREIQWSQLKVGALVLVAVAVLVGLIFLMSGSTGGLLARGLNAVCITFEFTLLEALPELYDRIEWRLEERLQSAQPLYPELRRSLMRRYPKHNWPENPLAS